jgi:hypothetical protein
MRDNSLINRIHSHVQEYLQILSRTKALAQETDEVGWADPYTDAQAGTSIQ